MTLAEDVESGCHFVHLVVKKTTAPPKIEKANSASPSTKVRAENDIDAKKEETKDEKKEEVKKEPTKEDSDEEGTPVVSSPPSLSADTVSIRVIVILLEL